MWKNFLIRTTFYSFDVACKIYSRPIEKYFTVHEQIFTVKHTKREPFSITRLTSMTYSVHVTCVTSMCRMLEIHVSHAWHQVLHGWHPWVECMTSLYHCITCVTYMCHAGAIDKSHEWHTYVTCVTSMSHMHGCHMDDIPDNYEMHVNQWTWTLLLKWYFKFLQNFMYPALIRSTDKHGIRNKEKNQVDLKAGLLASKVIEWEVKYAIEM